MSAPFDVSNYVGDLIFVPNYSEYLFSAVYSGSVTGLFLLFALQPSVFYPSLSAGAYGIDHLYVIDICP